MYLLATRLVIEVLKYFVSLCDWSAVFDFYIKMKYIAYLLQTYSLLCIHFIIRNINSCKKYYITLNLDFKPH